MKINWATFRSDRNFFLKYFVAQMLIAVGLAALIVAVRGVHFELTHFDPRVLWALPLAFAIGVKAPVMLHNAVHENYKPRWANDLLGELLGFFVLFGLAPFRISHILHHSFADTKQDPHPPDGKSFAHFLLTTQLNSIRVIRRKFLDYHGESLATHSILATEMAAYYVGVAGRIVAIGILLGPTFALGFYLPAWLTNLVVFAHINFATHVETDDGETELLNLDGNVYYRLVNFLGDGAYYHANHHRWPKRINPKYAAA